jgi:hypothetical protein
MEQYIDIVQSNGKDILKDRDPNVLESAAEFIWFSVEQVCAALLFMLHVARDLGQGRRIRATRGASSPWLIYGKRFRP